MRGERGASAAIGRRFPRGGSRRARSRAASCAAAGMGLLLLCVPVAARSAAVNGPSLPSPHAHFERPDACARCHVRDGENIIPDRFAVESDRFCLECHARGSLGTTHPLTAAARGRTTPDAFPRNAEGRMMCLTCHSGHGPYLSPARAFPGQRPSAAGSAEAGPHFRTFYLRRSSATEGFAALCRACHGKL